MTDPLYLASVYRLEATLFRKSAQILSASFPTPGTESPRSRESVPFYFLVSHAAELLLKSALLKRGATEADLKAPTLRHSLANLLGALEKHGVLITANCTTLVLGLHAQHERHALRYTALMDDGRPTFMPPPVLVFEMLDELLVLTRIATQGA